ncbi:MAG TPA: hypothetical protein VFO57_00635, partial [Burkholderiales bacterium]|nr:hypothetical protein [Burkholderiales bacterium]
MRPLHNEPLARNTAEPALVQRLHDGTDNRTPGAGKAMKKPAFYNEMYEEDGRVRPHYEPYARWLEGTTVEHLLQKQREADALYTRLGITFAVYGD